MKRSLKHTKGVSSRNRRFFIVVEGHIRQLRAGVTTKQHKPLNRGCHSQGVRHPRVWQEDPRNGVCIILLVNMSSKLN